MLSGNMPEGFLTGFSEKLDELEKMNVRQNEFMLSRVEKRVANVVEYDALYKYIAEVCEAGRLVFKNDPVKKKRYTISHIVKQLGG